MIDKLKRYRASIVIVRDGINSRYCLEGERVTEGKIRDNKFRDFITNEEFDIIDDINGSFEKVENIERGKRMALVHGMKRKY